MPSEPDADEYLPLFVYGTLRPGQGNYRLFLDGKTTRELPAILPDHAMFVLGRYPCIIEDAGAGDVTGDLLSLRPELFHELLAALDRLEGYRPGDASSLYVRVRRGVRATDADGRPLTAVAWAYVAGEPALPLRAACQPVPGGDWLAHRAG